jgi:ribosomal protein S12 methylthiotransferase accessory factor
MGCHPTRQIALIRALTEAAQTRLTVISGARDDITRHHFAQAYDQGDISRFRRWIDSVPVNQNFQNLPNADWDTLDAEVGWELERLQSVGIQQVITINLTHVEIGIPVVRIIIPGLEGPSDRFGYVPGRRAQAVLAASKENET